MSTKSKRRGLLQRIDVEKLVTESIRRKFEIGLAKDKNFEEEEMERETGIEPATSSLGSWRSTAELLPLENGS